jgi:hypothetical protein
VKLQVGLSGSSSGITKQFGGFAFNGLGVIPLSGRLTDIANVVLLNLPMVGPVLKGEDAIAPAAVSSWGMSWF